MRVLAAIAAAAILAAGLPAGRAAGQEAVRIDPDVRTGAPLFFNTPDGGVFPVPSAVPSDETLVDFPDGPAVKPVAPGPNNPPIKSPATEIEKIASLVKAIEAAQAKPADTPATVTTVGGDRIMGAVVAMESGGDLRLTGPHFSGEVRVRAASVSALVLGTVEAADVGDEVLLVGGQHVVGTVSAITEDSVLVDCGAAGRLKIPLARVQAITFAPADDDSPAAGGAALVDSAFAEGQMGAWQVAGNASLWKFQSGRLVFVGDGNASGQIIAKVPEGPITIVAKVAAVGSDSASIDLALLSDAGPPPPGGLPVTQNSGVTGMFRHGDTLAAFGYTGLVRVIGLRQLPVGAAPRAAGIVQMSYDPLTGRVSLLWNGAGRGEYELPLKSGGFPYVALTAYGATAVEYVRVFRGGPRPRASVAAPAPNPGSEIRVDFANEDHLTVRRVLLAEGQFRTATEHGEVRCPIGTVAQVVFAQREVEEPAAPRPGEIEVTGTFGQLTLQFVRLTAEELVGRSETLGEVHLRRSAIHEIKFAPAP